ncbi:MAG: hypothetical protein JWR26_224 [Pedosphaera sp.]|nr:hypothetical protein [Pedosphaera sp.]
MPAQPEATKEDESSTAREPARNWFGVLKQNLRDHFGWVAGLFLVGLGAKFWLIHRSGLPFPYWDEWDGEAVDMFIPWLQHQFSFASLFHAHNEHRIVFTRLCELGLFLANRQWDSQLEMVFNAFLHSGAIAAFGWLMASLIGKKYWPILWITLAMALVVPFAWENTLWGFQSQFYFMAIFSLLTLWLLGLSEPLSPRWLLGACVAVGTLFTMASGFLATVAVVGMTLVEVLKQRGNWRRHLPTWGLCVAIAIVGLLLKPDIALHHQLQARSVGKFLASLGKFLAWPCPRLAWYALFNLVPLAVLGWMYIRSKDRPGPAESLVLGIGFWVGLQALAAAYARGRLGTPPPWRYMDVCSFIMIANGLSILLLATRYRQQFRFPGFWRVFFALWVLGCLTGLCFLADQVLNVDIPEVVIDQQTKLKVARAFMATDDVSALKQERYENLMIPILEEEVLLLRHPAVRSILPACARDALPVLPVEKGDPAFIRNGWALAESDPPTEVSWGSYSAQGARARGGFESLPVRKSALPFLEIPVAGDLGEPGLSLELVEIATGKSTPVRPAHAAGQQWLNACVRAPAGEFKVVARDDSESKWFAFKAPREMGRLSFWAMHLLAAWKCFLWAGVGCVLFSLARLLIRRPGPEDATDMNRAG